MYWMGVYALIATLIFAMAGLIILILFVCCEATVWLHTSLSTSLKSLERGVPDRIAS